MTSNEVNLAIVFPGQGSQSVGMMDNIISLDPEIKKIFNIASEILGYNILEIISKGPKEKLNQTEITQPAILLTSYASWLLWKKKSKFPPTVLAGHSLGEYTALLCAGVITFEETVSLVSERAKSMQRSVPPNTGAMAAILGLNDKILEELCADVSKGEIVSAANYNSPGQIVISGHRIAVERVIKMAKEAGAKKAILLPVSVPSHCLLMRNAADEFSQFLNTVTFSDPEIPVLQNVDAKIKIRADEIKPVLLEQLYKPVRWVDSIKEINSLGVTRIIECGPGKVLCGLIKRIENSFELFSIHDQVSLENSLF
jgi:[acyl-carrier-protein] S-malonyltransferase|tara:strand:- start:127 stop:1065 length:939 start_codon:yes stop_codon:yes gene_type:complete